jgi:hypothetical protein
MDEADEEPLPILGPADLAPGSHHDGEFKIERSPIVAWRIEGDFAEPIALNPLFNGAFLTAVKCPSREIIARGYSLRWHNE